MRANTAKLLYLLLALVAFGSMLFYVASSAATLDSLLHYASRARPPFDFSDDPHFLAKPLPEARRAGITPRDRVVSVDGVPFTGMAGLIAQTYFAHPGQVFTVVYREHRGGSLFTAQVRLIPIRRSAPTFSVWLISAVLILLFSALCLFWGYWVALAKPHDLGAWCFLGVMNVVPAFIGRTGYFPGFLTPFTIVWQALAEQWMLISLILLAVYFPVRSRLDVRFPWFKWILIVPQILFVLCTILLQYGLLYHIRAVQHYLRAMDPLNLAGNVFTVLSIAIFIAAVVRKLFTAPTADARRRLGVVAAGSLLGLSPVLIILTISTLANKALNEVTPLWVIFAAGMQFALFPLSLAYTVIVQRALDLRIILRQGTRYALARGTLWVLQFIVIAFLGYRLFRLGRGFEQGSSHRFLRLVVPVVFVLLVFFLRLRIARPLSLWLDRRFFREAYSIDHVLSELSEQARSFTETEPLLKTIIERIGKTLHVDDISVLLRSGHTFHLQQANGLSGTVEISLPENSSTIRALARSREPALVYRENPEPWLSHASPAELSVLNDLHAELLLPLTGRSNLVGVMALGPKRSEEPYSRSDRQLLQSVALQVGLAIENSSLIHHLAQEVAARERIRSEIEIAGEVQQRLFPQVYPKIDGIEFAGLCRTAEQVGGDYYDFIALEDGRLGIAVGDVSGKGISAALLMASIRAALHGLTLSGTIDLARLMQRMNQIVYDSSTSNRFATFFFGEYDPRTRTLDYVNAGHNPPVLLRANGRSGTSPDAAYLRRAERLDVGGPVIGIFAEVQYEQGRIELHSQDVLVAFTDGISEAMKTDYEEWGDDRLISAAEKNMTRPAAEIATCMIDSVDAFTAGAKQFDDITIVILKAN